MTLIDEKPEKLVPVGQILIADDDPAFRGLLVRRAARMGLAVTEAEDGEQAVQLLKRQRFDVIVVDLYMPGRTGLEVFGEARKIDPSLQAIVLTGSATVESAVEALRAGVFDYLIKPLGSLAEFEMAVTRALEHHFLLLENARLFAEVQRLAVTDPLTGLFNRHKLNEALEVELERARRYSRPLSLIMIDMDRLKDINDTFGHPAGDSILQDVAAAITAHVRKVDLPTRFGGDEFLILLPEADHMEASHVAARISDRVSALTIGGRTVSASIGVSQWAEGLDTPDRFLQAVDQALYQSKRGAVRTTAAGASPSDGSSRNKDRDRDRK
jgi:diguanylate cyclase (GGDEF)-like protein